MCNKYSARDRGGKRILCIEQRRGGEDDIEEEKKWTDV
jgi:hypothetical protein